MGSARRERRKKLRHIAQQKAQMVCEKCGKNNHTITYVEEQKTMAVYCLECKDLTKLMNHGDYKRLEREETA